MLRTRDQYKYSIWQLLIPSQQTPGYFDLTSPQGAWGGPGGRTIDLPATIPTPTPSDTFVPYPSGDHIIWIAETFNPYIQADTGISRTLQFLPLRLGTGGNYTLTIGGWKLLRRNWFFSVIHVANVNCSVSRPANDDINSAHFLASSYDNASTPPNLFHLPSTCRVSFAPPISVQIDTFGFPVIGFFCSDSNSRILASVI